MVEVILVKRRAKAGEVGLFLDSSGVFDEEWSSLPHDVDIKAECTVPANLKYLRFFWALVGKIVDNSPEDRFLDKEECGNELKLAARHYKAVTDHLRNKTELKPKSVSNLSADTWIRLLRRCTHVVITQYLPGMEESALKAEIEKMLGMDVFAPQPKSQPKGGDQGKPPEPLPHSETIVPAARPITPSKGNSDVQDRKSTSQDARGSDHRAEETEERGTKRLSVPVVRELASGEQQEGKQGTSQNRPTSEPPRKVGPQTEDEYVTACRGWIAKQTDHRKALEYFDSDEQIAKRAELKLKVGTQKMLRRELAEHCEKLKET